MSPLRPYMLRILGQDFEIAVANPDDSSSKDFVRGFVTTRWVEAPSPIHAATQAFQLVREELATLHTVQQARSPAPRLTVIGIWQVESLETYPAPGKGFSFFSVSAVSFLDRLREGTRELWYRVRPSDRPWTYSEPF